MDDNRLMSGNTIRGSCSLFACRCCRTKYGWAHRDWCEISASTSPGCADCRYFNRKEGECRHPALKKEKGGFAV